MGLLRRLPRLVDRLVGPLAARLGVRFLQVYLERIGEVATALDLHVKLVELGRTRRFRAIVVAPPERVVNRTYLDYWRRYVRVVDSGPLLNLLRTAAWSPNLGYVPGADANQEILIADTQREWEIQGRPPLLQLTPEHAARGRDCLLRLGVPEGAWFACLHVREGGYLDEDPTSHRWYRNADVDTYLPAAREIVRRGGWVVRLGDPTMKLLPEIPGVVDYAHHELRSEWMDVYLAASCRFILGTTSGMIVVSLSFGVPIAAANFVPPGCLTKSSHDVYVPKLLRRVDDGRLLTFEEMLAPECAFLHDGRELARLGLEVVDSSPHEIEGLSVEMIRRLDGERPYTEEDELLQQRWKSLFRRYYEDGGSSRVGRDFLREQAHLFAQL